MDTFVEWLVFVTAVYGLANAIAVLKIGRYFLGTVKERKFLGKIPYIGDLFYCPPCVAFWIGLFISSQGFSPAASFVRVSEYSMIVDGLSASAIAYLLHMTAERLSHGLDV